MHSRRKVDVYYPELGIQKRGQQEKDNCALWDYYGHTHNPRNETERYKYDKINLNEFYEKTSPDFLLVSCKYKRRNCRSEWQPVLTLYG